MRYYGLASLLVLIVACDSPAETFEVELPASVTLVRAALAPDKRTDLVDVRMRGDTLGGYTTVTAAAARLQSIADSASYFYDVRILPAEDLGAKTYGIVRVAAANIRTEPGHSQELTSQALFGTPIRILDEEDGWFLVRTPDRYLAWLEPGAFTRVTKAELDKYLADELSSLNEERVIERHRFEGDGQHVAIRRGSLLLASEVGSSWEVHPASRNDLEVENLLNTAQTFVGQPYLWGGATSHGLDCSGFTKLSYQLNGFVIPRDASQQVRAGDHVELSDDLSGVERGDLLFFGNFRDDGSERITHVGFYLGGGRFLHAGADNGSIQENSLVESAVDFAKHRKETLMRARRLSVGSPGVVPLLEAFQAL